jgi:hypothetical protein
LLATQDMVLAKDTRELETDFFTTSATIAKEKRRGCHDNLTIPGEKLEKRDSWCQD